MSTAKPPLWVTLTASFRADARKTAVLVVLMAVMAVVYARVFIKGAGASTADAGALPAAFPAPAATQPAARERVTLQAAPARELAHDPFAVDLDKYPAAHAGNDPKAVVSGHADDAIRKDAESLVLQSTVCGRRPMACISGQFLYPGQQINGFELRRVEPTRVLLQREGVQVILLLK